MFSNISFLISKDICTNVLFAFDFLRDTKRRLGKPKIKLVAIYISV